MTVPPTYTYKRSGPTWLEIAADQIDGFVAEVLADHRAVPFVPVPSLVGRNSEAKKPKNPTPFFDTGHLVGAFFYRGAKGKAKQNGTLGRIYAPGDRFNSTWVRNKFLDRLFALWAIHGIGFARKFGLAAPTKAGG